MNIMNANEITVLGYNAATCAAMIDAVRASIMSLRNPRCPKMTNILTAQHDILKATAAIIGMLAAGLLFWYTPGGAIK